MRIHKTFGEDLPAFMRLWERIHETSGDDLQAFGRGFARDS